MEPTQTPTSSIPPSTQLPPMNSSPKTSLMAAGALVVLIGFGVFAWFVWPGFAQKEQSTTQSIVQAYNANNLDAALAQTDAFLSQDPNNSNLLALKATILAQKGSLLFKEEEFGARAVVLAELAIQADPQNSEAFRALGYAYEIQQNYPKAHENYQKAIALDATNVGAVFSDAHAYDLQGDMVAAEKGYRAALALDKNSAQAHGGLARVLMSKGDLQGALEEQKQVLILTQNVRSKAESAYSISGMTLVLGDTVAARNYALQATTLDPEYPLGWFALGRVQLAEARATTATDEELANKMMVVFDSYQKAIALNPNQSIVYYEMARVHYEMLENATEALEDLKQADAAVVNDITLNAPSKEMVREKILKLRTTITSTLKK